MCYSAVTLHDGTILAAYPMRRPSPRILKRDFMRIDEDGVMREFSSAGRELSDWHNETRMRFQDIIANRLNTRRALRELVLEPIAGLRSEVAALRTEIDRLTTMLSAGEGRGGPDPR